MLDHHEASPCAPATSVPGDAYPCSAAGDAAELGVTVAIIWSERSVLEPDSAMSEYRWVEFAEKVVEVGGAVSADAEISDSLIAALVACPDLSF